MLEPLVWIHIKQDHPDERKIRHHTKNESATGNEPLILSIEDLEIFTHFNMQHHEVITEWFDIFIQQSHAFRNPDKLSLDLRLWGWSHTLNLPKCYLHINLLHHSRSHSKPPFIFDACCWRSILSIDFVRSSQGPHWLPWTVRHKPNAWESVTVL